MTDPTTTDWTGYVESVLRLKDRRVAGADFSIDGSDDIGPVIQLNDDLGPILMCFIHDVQRDHALEFLHRAIPAYGATEIFVSFDVHYTTSPINPRTNQPWKSGEIGGGKGDMQLLCDNENACSTGLITDAIMCQSATREHMHYENHGYHVHKSAKTVAWHDDDEALRVLDTSTGGHLEGLIPDVIRDAFQQPTLYDKSRMNPKIKELLDATLEQLDPYEARLHRMLGVTALLAQDPRWTILLTLRNEEEKRVAEESQERWRKQQEAELMLLKATMKVGIETGTINAAEVASEMGITEKQLRVDLGIDKQLIIPGKNATR